ncbi:MAG: peptide chain release factor N(5)-glutamine methyltransferase [Rikenellaceae bacterium]|nr:peptide chain release factor N(5)-glutamine methyltransferase [Rikenellaceae bacterium]
MNIKNFLDYIRRELSEIYSPEEIRSIALILLEERFGIQRHEVFLYPDMVVPEAEIVDAVEMLAKYYPVQYITGYGRFMDMKFTVNEHVLIPRPETEELVRWILSENLSGTVPHILDIGTGSGCIAVSLAKNLGSAKISAVDVSEEALKMAEYNAEVNEVTVEFIKADILSEKIDGSYDIIASNPPYVTVSEKSSMRKNVLDHEPHLALFVDDSDPLLFYKKIAELGTVLLNRGGRLYFEINEKFGVGICRMLEGMGYGDVILRKDIFDKDRMVRAVWN